jgi:hypothetical protein
MSEALIEFCIDLHKDTENDTINLIFVRIFLQPARDENKNEDE